MSFLSSENLTTYLLRELIQHVTETCFPNDYMEGSELYSTIRNIILISKKSSNDIRKDSSGIFSKLINLPLSEEDVDIVYREIFTGVEIRNKIVRKELVMYFLLKEARPDFAPSDQLLAYLNLFRTSEK